MRVSLPRRNTDRTSAGQSIVELALTMPLLLLVMLGTIDVGRVFLDYIEMRNAVVEGATYGARHPLDGGGIAAVVNAHGIPDSAVISSSTNGSCGEPQGDGTITVSTRFSVTPLFFASLSSVASGVDWNFDVGASSTMRCLT